MRKLLLAVVLLVGLAWADRSPDSGHLTVLAEPWGEIYCTKQCSFSKDIHHRVTINSPKGRVHVAPSGQWTNVQFPGHTARVRHTENEVLVQFANQNYRFLKKSKREFQLVFPGETVYYTLRDGGVKTILGPNGALTVKRSSAKVTFEVTSDTGGTSTYQVRSSQPKGTRSKKDRLLRLKTVDGGAPETHPYLHRGVRFEDNGVGIFIPISGGPLLAALDWKATRVITHSVETATAPAAPAPPAVNPLKAQTTDGSALKASTPANGTLKAQTSSNTTLKAQAPDRKAPDPLKANIVPRGQDNLKVQEFDPNQ